MWVLHITVLLLLLPPSLTTVSEGFKSETCKAGACMADFDTSTEGRLQPIGLFKDVTEEVDFSEIQVVEGKVPDWLSGSMYKVGVGAFNVGSRRVNNVIDALSKVYRWSFKPGKAPSFSTKFLKTGIYNRSIDDGELVPHKVVGDILPPVSTFEKVKMALWDSARDNNNITPWKLKGRDGITVTGESPLLFDVEKVNLDFLEKYKFFNKGSFVKEFMSASHYARHPTTGDSYNYVYMTGLDKGLLTGVEPGYEMIRVTQDESGKAVGEVVGFIKSSMSDIRIIHSLGVTENYVILPRLSLRADLNSTFHVCSNIVFDDKAPTYMHVMSIKDGSYKTFEFPSFISVHIVNSFERTNEKGETEVVLDYPTLTTMEGFNHERCYYEILNIEYMLSDQFSYRKDFKPLTDVTIRRFVMNMATGKGEVLDHPKLWKPQILHVDFPFVNDNFRGKPFCIVYFHTIQWDNRNAMGILKLDLCKQTSANWDDFNLFPVEPVFVPRPGAVEEDDGVLMSPVYDARTETSELYIWNAKDMKVIARLSSPVLVPWTNHGMWLPEE
ncbi:hypothetical protein ACHWQZ_G006235 [Mnemiopsis leidyi]